MGSFGQETLRLTVQPYQKSQKGKSLNFSKPEKATPKKVQPPAALHDFIEYPIAPHQSPGHAFHPT